jgi:hypothetical protein
VALASGVELLSAIAPRLSGSSANMCCQSRDHPEAMQLLQDRKMAEVVEQNRAAFETPFGSAWAGAEKGDVVLVEFFDYACGYCRKSNSDIERLLDEDKQLKVVWRELPCSGPIASRRGSQPRRGQTGRFKEFYSRLFASGRPAPAAVRKSGTLSGFEPRPVRLNSRPNSTRTSSCSRASAPPARPPSWWATRSPGRGRLYDA